MLFSSRSGARPRIGMLWGDFPWSMSPAKLGKLLSIGRVARDVTRALQTNCQVIPYCPPQSHTLSTFSFDQFSQMHREELLKFLRGIDILWADLYPASAFALELRHEYHLPCPAILFAGGTLPKGAEAMLFPWQTLLRPTDGLLFNCRADQAIWRRLVQESTLREWVVPLSVDETVFHPRAERDVIRTQYHLPVQAPVLLYVGRLNIQKNVHSLLYLLAAVRKQLPDVQLCLVGEEDTIQLGEFGVRNTGYIAWLRSLVAELDLTDSVRFMGSLFGEDLARIYAAADVVVNLGFYHRENFGLAQAEAAACGVPVVCTAWGGFKDVIQEGDSGYFVDAVLSKHGMRVDWATGADRVLALLRQPELRAQMGQYATIYAREHFSIAALSTSLANVVEEIQMTGEQLSTSPAYEPSQFAARYDAHKWACGWYADDTADDAATRWYPAMFQGQDYALYETLMQPYATCLAGDLVPDTLQPEWVPYFPAAVKLDPVRLLISSEDPIWPHHQFASPDIWEIACLIDGQRTLASLRVHVPHIEHVAILWRLYLEGFVLFMRR